MQLRYMDYSSMPKEREKECDLEEALFLFEWINFRTGSFLVINFGAENALQFAGAEGSGELTAEIVINNPGEIAIWSRSATKQYCVRLITELDRSGALNDFSGFAKTVY